MMRSINPYDGSVVAEVPLWRDELVTAAIDEVADRVPQWQATSIEQRCDHLRKIAVQLRSEKQTLATLISREMGKLIGEAEAEVEKCAWVCDYYADEGPGFLQDETIESDAGHSYVTYQPLGIVLAVMPWNFPFWQVFRFVAPALVAGNSALLKHASNVPGAAREIEALLLRAGLPQGVFRSLMISAAQVAQVIDDPRVAAVTLTGSDGAGRSVAAAAGGQLKKSLLELGGSDAFIVLEDADLDRAVEVGVISRFLNGGQSCIAAKRFIVVEAIAEPFLEKFQQAVEALKVGDPLDGETTLAPMARSDLRDELHQQVEASLVAGAVARCGCHPLEGTDTGYAPSILDGVAPGMPAYREELFGPVAIVIRAKDEADAIRIANDSPFGLGGSVWTADLTRGAWVAHQVETGAMFVNGLVKSDPRLPFGGIKQSGYGRELSRMGILEFVNAKTVWMAAQ